jgi:hypothetical protein
MGTKRDDHLASACADAELTRLSQPRCSALVFSSGNGTTVSLTPLQRSYMTEYIRSQVGATFHAHETYRLLYLGGGTAKPRLAFPVDFVAGTTTLPTGQIVPVALSELAIAQGYRSFYRGPEQKLADVSLHRWLRQTVYDDEGLLSLFAVALIEGAACLIVMLWFAVPRDIKRFKQMKYGRILRGPNLLTPEEFNKKQKGDGVGFKTTELGKMMRIPRNKEAQHFQIMGDTGVGKTQLIMQVLRQIRERGESAIVYDPACEYLQRFYDKESGDIVLNPLDARCPYWGPAQEMASNAEADAIAGSLYQSATDVKDEFFHQTPAQIFCPSIKEGADPASARRMDGKQRHIGDAGRWHRDVFLHRPQGRRTAGGCFGFAWIGGEMLPSIARKEPDRPDLERPDLGQGTQGMDIHYVASTGARDAAAASLPLD